MVPLIIMLGHEGHIGRVFAYDFMIVSNTSKP
jgi:hypothetical protein